MFSFKSLFAPKVIIVGKSELSHPTQCERIEYQDPRKQELKVLEILSHSIEMTASQMDRHFPSGWRRLNDLLHKGLVDNIGNRTRMIYKLNGRGYDYLLKL